MRGATFKGVKCNPWTHFRMKIRKCIPDVQFGRRIIKLLGWQYWYPDLVKQLSSTGIDIEADMSWTDFAGSRRLAVKGLPGYCVVMSFNYYWIEFDIVRFKTMRDDPACQVRFTDDPIYFPGQGAQSWLWSGRSVNKLIQQIKLLMPISDDHLLDCRKEN